jgi:predicted RNA-binding Zn ribbon-like protein
MDRCAGVDDEVLLELLNTTPVVDGVPHDRIAADADAHRWALAHGGIGTAAELTGLRDVRDRLQAVVRGADPATALDAALRAVRLRPHPHPGGIDWRLDTAAERRLPAGIVLAWARVAAELPGRLRPCANAECRLFLLDRSRAGAARWCSMRTCGNRLKARRHQQRRQDPAAG